MSKNKRNGKQTTTSPADMSDVEKIFRKFDKNGDGKISLAELNSVLAALGSCTSQEELERVMKEIDTNGDGSIDLREFAALNLLNNNGNSRDNNNNKEVRDAFELYDKDKNGVISARELHAVMKGLGEKVSLRECCKMIKSVDVDGDGCVNFEEFKKMMLR